MVIVIFQTDGKIANAGLSLALPDSGRKEVDLSLLPNELTAEVVDDHGVYVTSVDRQTGREHASLHAWIDGDGELKINHITIPRSEIIQNVRVTKEG